MSLGKNAAIGKEDKGIIKWNDWNERIVVQKKTGTVLEVINLWDYQNEFCVGSREKCTK